VINTSKPKRDLAVAYYNYIIKAIKAKPLFTWIEFHPRQIWQYLLWMDPSNHGGVLALEEDAAPSQSAHSVELAGRSERTSAPRARKGNAPGTAGLLTVPRPLCIRCGGVPPGVEMLWNLKEYLPPITRQYFELLVAEFIYEMYKHTAAERAAAAAANGGHANGATTNGMQAPTDGVAPSIGADDVDVAASSEFVRHLVGHTIGQKLFKILPDLRRQLARAVTGGADDADGGVDPAAAQFPRLAGSYLQLTDPMLEFIKYVVQVVQLDARAAKEAQVLRKNALRLIDVKEFAAEANFQNPCMSFKLADVFCNFCNDCRDMDLGRDLHLMNADGTWTCDVCNHEYNRAAIEETLVGLLQRHVTSYQLQDLRCLKCDAIKVSNLTEYCRCSGRYTNTEPSQRLRETYVATAAGPLSGGCPRLTVGTFGQFALLAGRPWHGQAAGVPQHCAVLQV